MPGELSFIEVAGIGVGLSELLLASELGLDGSKPHKAGVALPIERHAHAPDHRDTVIGECAIPLWRPRVDDLVLGVLTLQVGAGHVEADALAAQQHRNGHRGLDRGVVEGLACSLSLP